MESEGTGTSLPWQGFVALAVALAGAYYYLNPLDTSRPVERSGVEFPIEREQDVAARLWQDPLLAVYVHEGAEHSAEQKVAARTSQPEPPRHSRAGLKEGIAKASGEGLWVLPVLIPGGAAADYQEDRLRMRRAVLDGLASSRLVPHDSEHLGYIRMPRYPPPAPSNLKRDTSSTPCAEAAAAAQEAAGNLYLLPYEWFNPMFEPPALRGDFEHRRVLVLWVREDELAETPLHGLSNMLQILGIDSAATPVKVIGPRSSDGLRAMLKEAAQLQAGSTLLRGVEEFSATPTAPDSLICQGVVSAGSGSAPVLKSIFEEKLKDFKFHRVTATDDEVSRVLVAELARRGVDVTPASKDQCHVAVISEWDTFYGRALPLAFAAQTQVPGVNPDLSFPTHIHDFHYARGIDGMVPGASAGEPKETSTKARSSEKPDDSPSPSPPRETTEGLNQADYLRRLATQIRDEHENLLYQGVGGIQAIGVLGSDVYDKLLILKALRTSMPHALYFTNSLDARLGHPDEWNAARNLIVVSPYGLRLEWADSPAAGRPAPGPDDAWLVDVRRKVPPFRDSYQTAIYAATLMAGHPDLANSYADNPKLRGGPYIFEISRSGPYPLTSPGGPPRLTHAWWSPWRIRTLALLLAGRPLSGALGHPGHLRQASGATPDARTTGSPLAAHRPARELFSGGERGGYIHRSRPLLIMGCLRLKFPDGMALG